MSDYIKREVAIEQIKKEWAKLPLSKTTGFAILMRVLRKLPAADVIEQKHGKWIEDGYYDEPYVCSICGEPAPVKEEGSHDHVCTKYCYNCGARMDGE